MGGGRQQKEDEIDPSVGVVFHVAVATRVEDEQPLADIHARDDESARATEEALRHAIRISDRPQERPLILRTL